MSTEAEATTSRRAKGAGFPTLPLPEAVKIIREAGQYGKEHTPSALAAYAGHQSANSGPWKSKAAALKEWGLIATASPDKITLTSRAVRLAHPESTEKAHAALLECFTGSAIFMAIYNDLARGQELSVAQLSSKAISDHSIAIASKEKFVNSFLESATAAGLAERIGKDKFKTFPISHTSSGPATDSGSDDADAGAGDRDGKALDGGHTGSAAPARSDDRRDAGTPVMQQTWEFASGEVRLTINSTKPLQAKSYTDIANVVAAVEALISSLGTE